MQLWHWEEQRNEEGEGPTSIGNLIISYCRWSSSVETEAGVGQWLMWSHMVYHSFRPRSL